MNGDVAVASEYKEVEAPVVTCSTFASTLWCCGRLFFGTLVLVLFVIGYAAYHAGSLRRAVPYLMGQRFFVAESVIALGSVSSGSEVETSIELTNCGAVPASVVGARTSCGCITLDVFPFEVAANSTRPMHLKMRVPEVSTEFEHTIELYVADQRFSSFQIVLFGASLKD